MKNLLIILLVSITCLSGISCSKKTEKEEAIEVEKEIRRVVVYKNYTKTEVSKAHDLNETITFPLYSHLVQKGDVFHYLMKDIEKIEFKGKKKDDEFVYHIGYKLIGAINEVTINNVRNRYKRSVSNKLLRIGKRITVPFKMGTEDKKIGEISFTIKSKSLKMKNDIVIEISKNNFKCDGIKLPIYHHEINERAVGNINSMFWQNRRAWVYVPYKKNGKCIIKEVNETNLLKVLKKGNFDKFVNHKEILTTYKLEMPKFTTEKKIGDWKFIYKDGLKVIK